MKRTMTAELATQDGPAPRAVGLAVCRIAGPGTRSRQTAARASNSTKISRVAEKKPPRL
jgi:hypothetical protein